MSKCDVLKKLLLVFNFTFFLLALIIFVFSFVVLIKYNAIDGRVKSYSIFGLVDGSLIFFLALVGFCGIVRQNICKLQTLTFSATLIAIIHTVLATVNFAIASDLNDKKTKQTFAKIFSSYDQEYKHKHHVDEIQHHLKCCGLDGPQSWSKVPNSCCEGTPCDRHTAFQKSCSKSLDEKYKAYKAFRGTVTSAVVVVACVLAVLSFCATRKALRRRGARQTLD